MSLQGQATSVVVACSLEVFPLHPLLFWHLGASGILLHVQGFLVNYCSSQYVFPALLSGILSFCGSA